jgi:hypothetical protein
MKNIFIIYFYLIFFFKILIFNYLFIFKKKNGRKEK